MTEVEVRPKGPTRKKRALLGVVDQLIFSFSNIVLLIVGARELSVDEFGAFALVLTTGTLVISIIRGLTSEVLVVRFAGPDDDAWRHGSSASSGAALATSLLPAAAFAVIGVALGGMAGATLLALAVSLPGVAVQDSLRYVALTAKRPRAAIANDAVQTTIQLVVMGAAIAAGHREPWQFVLAWGLGSYVAAVVAAAALASAPDLRRVRGWFRDQWDLASRYAIDNLILTGSQNVGSYMLGLAAPVSAVGAVRGGQLLYTPPAVLGAGVRSSVTPEIVRGMQREKSRLRQDVRAIAVGMGAVSLVWGLVVVLIPDSLGVQLLGPTWHNAEPLLVYFAFAQVVNGMWIGPLVGLRALGAARRTLLARTQGTVFVIAGQVAGALLGGALGVAIASAIVRPVQLGIWWYHYSRAASQHASRHAPSSRARLRQGEAE